MVPRQGQVGESDQRRRLVLTAGTVAAAMGGRLVAGGADCAIGGVSIDSRTISPGDLFFAIRGTRHDGHTFMRAAVSAGAAGVVAAVDAAPVQDGWPAAAVLILVEDTIRALQMLAQHVRRESGSQVVAVTGSTGKTTTKEIAAAFLGLTRRVVRSPGNLNNHIGVPLSLVGLCDRPDVAVIEMAMNHPGEISMLVELARPEVRVWTNVAPVHTEFFASLEAIADAKAELLEGATSQTVVIANAADPLVMDRVARSPARCFTFAVDAEADVRAVDVISGGLDGMTARIESTVGSAVVRTPLVGRGNVGNLMAAVAVGLHYEVPLARMVECAASLKPMPHRGEVLRLPGGVTLFDDSYNSNPAALRHALEIVAHEHRCARRVAVIGEMLELGEQSHALHCASGQAAAAAGLQRLVTVGGSAARALGEAAIRAGLPASAVSHALNSEEAADLAAGIVRPGDLVFVKGSRGIRTEIVAERIKVEFG